MPKKPKRKIKIKRRARRSERRITEIGLQTYRDKLRERDMTFPKSDWRNLRTVFDDMLPPEQTINRIPKVEWTK